MEYRKNSYYDKMIDLLKENITEQFFRKDSVRKGTISAV